MTNPVYVGLAVTSHNDGVIAAGAFDNLTITGAHRPRRRARPLYLEAENGTLTSPLQLVSDAGASNGLGWQVTPGNNSGVPSPPPGTPPIRSSSPAPAPTGSGAASTAPRPATIRSGCAWTAAPGSSGTTSATAPPGAGTPRTTLWPAAHRRLQPGRGQPHPRAGLPRRRRPDRPAAHHQRPGAEPQRQLPESPAVTRWRRPTAPPGPRLAGLVSAEVFLPNLGGIDEAHASTGRRQPAPGVRLVAGAGHGEHLGRRRRHRAAAHQPARPQHPVPLHRHRRSEDLSGDRFIPFTSSFTTGTGGGGGPTVFNFRRCPWAAPPSGSSSPASPSAPTPSCTPPALTGEIVRWTTNGTACSRASRPSTPSATTTAAPPGP